MTSQSEMASYQSRGLSPSGFLEWFLDSIMMMLLSLLTHAQHTAVHTVYLSSSNTGDRLSLKDQHQQLPVGVSTLCVCSPVDQEASDLSASASDFVCAF